MKPKMIPRWTLIVAAILIVVALMAGAALARTGSETLASPTSHYHLTGTLIQSDSMLLSGGHYQLIDVTLRNAQGSAGQANDLASGGGYHLEAPAGPQLTGNGCCCTFLPCVRR